MQRVMCRLKLACAGRHRPDLASAALPLAVLVVSLCLCFSGVSGETRYMTSALELHPSRQPCLFESWSPRDQVGGEEDESLKMWLEDLYSHANREGYLGMIDGTPSLMKTRNGRDIVMCANAKVGSSSWKHLFLRSFGWEASDMDEVLSTVHHHKSDPWTAAHLWDGAAANFADTVMSPDLNSFIMVRNPYTRLVSGFLNKIPGVIAHGCYETVFASQSMADCIHNTEIIAPYDDSPAMFAMFVRDLYAEFQRSGSLKNVDIHFKPLSLGCGMDAGLHYDFILKTEEIDTWYPDLVKSFGMHDLVSSDWAKYHRSDKLQASEDVPDCFYHSRSSSCKEMNRIVAGAGDQGRCHASSPSVTSNNVGDGYAQSTNANSRLSEYFTPELYMLASEMYATDLEEFGYEKMMA